MYPDVYRLADLLEWWSNELFWFRFTSTVGRYFCIFLTIGTSQTPISLSFQWSKHDLICMCYCLAWLFFTWKFFTYESLTDPLQWITNCSLAACHQNPSSPLCCCTFCSTGLFDFLCTKYTCTDGWWVCLSKLYIFYISDDEVYNFGNLFENS